MNQALPVYASYRDMAQRLEVALFPMDSEDGQRAVRVENFDQQLQAMAIVYGRRLPEFLMAGAEVAQRHSLSSNIHLRFHATRLANFVFARAAAQHDAGVQGYATLAAHTQAALFKSINAISATPFMPRVEGEKSVGEQHLEHFNDRFQKTVFADYLALAALGNARFGADELRDVFYNDVLAMAANLNGLAVADVLTSIAQEAKDGGHAAIARLIDDTVTDCVVRDDIMLAQEAARACMWVAYVESPLQQKARSLFPYVWEKALANVRAAPKEQREGLDAQLVAVLNEAKELFGADDAFTKQAQKIYDNRNAVLRVFPVQEPLHKPRGGCGRVVMGENISAFGAVADEAAVAKPKAPSPARHVCGRVSPMNGFTPPAKKLPSRKIGEPTLH